MRGHPFNAASYTGKARKLFESDPMLQLTPHQLSVVLGLTKLQTYTVIRNLKLQGICESTRIVRARKVAA